jgi:hypothetical protein
MICRARHRRNQLPDVAQAISPLLRKRRALGLMSTSNALVVVLTRQWLQHTRLWFGRSDERGAIEAGRWPRRRCAKVAAGASCQVRIAVR